MFQDEYEPAGTPVNNISLTVVFCDDRGGMLFGGRMARKYSVIVIGISAAGRSRQHPSDAATHPELVVFDRYGPLLARADNG
jgi:hypothetical protein